MQTVKLNNGVEMPILGYGVFLVDPKECERCVTDAIDVGYRMIDTAQAYYNEEGVGAAIKKSGINREEFFLVTKVWITNSGEEKAVKSIEESLKKLQTDYVDLLLIHQPFGDYYGTYRAMEKAYKDGKTIFKDLSFAVPEGINVLIGENGIGKTTLSRLIFGLEKLSGGKIEFKDPKGKKPLQLGSIVLQNTDYQLNMQTVYQEVAICMTLAEGIKPQPGKVMELLEKLDLSALSYRHPQSLSGGQKQRLVIACALAKNPQVLVLDEPTSGLDGANMQRIKNILHDYAKDGRAALVITHDLELIDDKNLKALRLKKESV